MLVFCWLVCCEWETTGNSRSREGELSLQRGVVLSSSLVISISSSHLLLLWWTFPPSCTLKSVVFCCCTNEIIVVIHIQIHEINLKAFFILNSISSSVNSCWCCFWTDCISFFTNICNQFIVILFPSLLLIWWQTLLSEGGGRREEGSNSLPFPDTLFCFNVPQIFWWHSWFKNWS